ncbi:hypothetical protein Tcan_09433 [Toxocara canis]|uniref:Uncharacterized protein n=1 Tax=Toxocara canis TaxID=6265 RepID=A0A0B2W2K1_TOXCA|nr:hypothetical protein Tcan_09433 [Toxocara canis]
MSIVITKHDLDTDEREAFYAIERAEEAECLRTYEYAIGITILFILLYAIIFVVFLYIFRRTFKREIRYTCRKIRKLIWRGRKPPTSARKDETQFHKKARKNVTESVKPTTEDTKIALMQNAKPSIAPTSRVSVANSSISYSTQQRPTATGTMLQSSAGARTNARKRKSNSDSASKTSASALR